MRHVFVCLGLLPLLACSGPPVETHTDELLAAPSIRRLLPPRGHTDGGVRVTIDGENFADGVRVFFGDNEGVEVDRLDTQHLTVKTPPASRAQPVKVRVMNRDGQYAVLDNAFIYDDEFPVITAADLSNGRDEVVSTNSKVVTHTVRAAVEIPGTTTGPGKGKGVRAQVGWAPFSEGSVARMEDFLWTEANYVGDVGGRINGGTTELDQYSGTITLPPANGSVISRYFLSARFSVDGGAEWVVAGVRGARSPPSPDAFGVVRVQRAVVEWCKIGDPTVTPGSVPEERILEPGKPLEIPAQVYHGGYTNSSGAANLLVEFGYGPPGSHPDGQEWKWLQANFRRDMPNPNGELTNDEWVATVPGNLPPGNYSMVYRMSVDNGPIRYCDSDGTSENDFTVDQLMPLRVGSETSRTDLVHWCKLGTGAVTDPAPQLTQTVGGAAHEVRAQAYHPNTTEAPGAGQALKVHLGIGPETSGVGSADWRWIPAEFREDVSNNDVYSASLPTDLPPGRYRFVYRIVVNEGAGGYCDVDGTSANADPSGFDPALMGTLTVTAPGTSP